MTDFVISLDGENGTFTVDGEQPELFGALVGCQVTDTVPLPRNPRLDEKPFMIEPRRKPVVEVTLRLPMGHGDRLMLLRENGVKVVYGPTGDSEATIYRRTPGPTTLRIVGGAPDVVDGEHVALRGDCVCGEGYIWRAETDGVHVARWLKQHENCQIGAAHG